MKPFNNIPNKLITDTDGNKHWISPSISVDAMVVVGDEVLVIKRSKIMSNPNMWCLPCGFMDFNESPLLACIRELFEETGIDIRETDVINIDYQRPHSLNGTALQFLFVLPEKPDIILNTDECLSYEWLTVSELKKFDFAFGHDFLIKNIFHEEIIFITKT